MVLLSPEDVTINGIRLSTQFQSGDGYFIVNEVRGRSLAPRALQLVQAAGQDGAHFLGSTLEVRPLEIDFTMKGSSFADLRLRMEELNGILIQDELLEIRFDDEPNRVYFGTVQSGSESLEKSRIHKGTISIVRPDPYKYGNEIIQDIVSGATTVENGGNYPTYPKFTFTAARDISFVDVFTDRNYMRIGQPTDVGSTPVATQERVLFDPAESTVGWTASSTTESGAVAGTITSNGASFQPSSFGSGTGWHGPAIQRSIPEAPLTDFMVEARIIFNNPTTDALGRLVIELLDDMGAIMGRMNMNKRAVGTHGNEGVIRAGGINGHELIEFMGQRNIEWKNFNGILRISRKGNVWEAYIAQVNPSTGAHHSRAYATFRDTAGTFAAPLAQIRVAFGIYGARTAAPMAVQDIKVFRINTPPDPSAAPEIIARAGDVITIDHAIDLIAINGEPRIDLKDFGASFFPFENGLTTVLVEPSADLVGSVSFRERFL